MIKKILTCLLLALAMTVLLQRQVVQSIARWAQTAWPQGEEAGETAHIPPFSDQLGAGEAHDKLDVTLYYRCEDAALLSARQAQLDLRREETIATSIVKALIDGPGAASGLDGLFPRGTSIISVNGEGATAFVTLSRDFLGRPDGAPADWEDLAEWQEEAALRRMLAVQSLVLSLTEDGRFQRVQLYVADHDDDVPERIPLCYFSLDVTDPGVMLAACSRDESYLLTPRRVLLMALDCWQRRDYDALHAMLTDGREPLPEREAFAAKMRELDVTLLTCEATDGSVSYDGQRATLVLNARISTPQGGETEIRREAVPLHREAGNWMMTYDTLLSLMIRD